MMRCENRFLSSAVLLVLFVILLTARVGASVTGWTRNYGGMDSDYATALVEASDGGYAIAGYTESFGAGNDDFWLIKTDSVGNLEWNQTYGGPGSDRAYSLVQTSDGGYALAGWTTSGDESYDFWLVKTDAQGNMEWNQTYGGADYEAARSLVETSDGGYAMAGETRVVGTGGSDFWLVRTDESGNMLWNQTYGGSGHDVAYSLIQTSDGGFAMGGELQYNFWLVKTDSQGNMEWNQTYSGGGRSSHNKACSLIESSDGGYVLAGTTDSAYGDGLLLVKTNELGDVKWNQTYGGEGGMGIWATYSVVETSDGGYAVAGNFGADFWLVKIDAQGNMEWNQKYGGTRVDRAVSLVQASDGGFAIAGYTASFIPGNDDEYVYDAWLVKTDEEGKIPEYHVRIKADGTVEGTDKIQRNGNVYTFTDDIFVAEFSVEKHNIIVDGNGYTLRGSGSYGGGIGFNLTNRVNVTIKNTKIQNLTTGIIIYGSFNNTITGNTINDNNGGIHLKFVYDNVISGNEITANKGLGIYFFAGSHNIISGNNITDNSDGFHMYGSYNTISGNNIASNDNGLVILDSSMYNHIKENTITNQTNGIHLTRSTYNSIFENNITDNNVGMYFYKESSNNTIYSNNFVKNDQQIFIDPKNAENLSVNVWDKDAEGNYWSNYAGTGDTPYIIDENNHDNYPRGNQYIIPEFSSWILLQVFVTATLFVLIIKKKLFHPHS